MSDDHTERLADHLRTLRKDQGWSLDRLSDASGVSRATLSRLENAEVSPTTEVLGKLCAAFGIRMSRLLSMVEAEFRPVIRRDEQAVWKDPGAGFTRRAVSPTAPPLAAEVLDCRLEPNTTLSYDAPPTGGLEHHLVMVDGHLEVTVDGVPHVLGQGDCLRYRLHGSSRFRTSETGGARYFLFLV
jgi:transcriptional regulator with XRE-family HTH domain